MFELCEWFVVINIIICIIIVCVGRMLLSSETMQQFNRARVYLDEDFTAVEKFTVSSRSLLQYSVDSVECFK